MKILLIMKLSEVYNRKTFLESSPERIKLAKREIDS